MGDLYKILLITRKDFITQLKVGFIRIFVVELFYPIITMIILFVILKDPSMFIRVVIGLFSYQIFLDITDKVTWSFTYWESWSIENLMSLPVKDRVLILGKSLFGIIYSFLRATFLLLIGLIILQEVSLKINIISFIVYLTLGFVISSLIGVALLGIWLIRRSLANFFQKMIYMLFAIYGGVFFDPTLIIGGNVISKFIPLYYITNAIRASMLYGEGLSMNILAILILWIIILFPISIKLYKYGKFNFNPHAI